MLIGFTGFARVGKDTAAEALIKEGFEQCAFADVLKEQCSQMLATIGLYPDFRDPQQKEEWRDFLVFWGRRMRQLDENYWIDKLVEDIGGFRKRDIVITDVRYLNEVDFILQKGGSVYWIYRPGYGPANEEEEISFKKISLHYSHKDLNMFSNAGTIEELHEKVIKNVYGSHHIA